MSIFRNHKHRNYTVLDNKVLQDEALSWKARGILAYLLSLPEDWDIHITEVINHAPDGEASLRSGVKELRDAGYIVYQKGHDEQGHFQHEYHVYETPQQENHNPQKPDVENPDVGSPGVDNPALQSNDEQSNDEQSNDNNNQAPTKSSFEKIVKALEQNHGRMYSKTQVDRVLQFVDDGMMPELVCEAIQKGMEGNNPYQYTLGVLRNWVNEQIYTLDDLKEHEDMRASPRGDDGLIDLAKLDVETLMG